MKLIIPISKALNATIQNIESHHDITKQEAFGYGLWLVSVYLNKRLNGHTVGCHYDNGDFEPISLQYKTPEQSNIVDNVELTINKEGEAQLTEMAESLYCETPLVFYAAVSLLATYLEKGHSLSVLDKDRRVAIPINLPSL